MSREFDDIPKKIDQSRQDLYKSESITNEKILQEIHEVKKEVNNIAFKVDTMLEILNNFSIMLIEDDENLEDNYEDEEDDESWVPPEQDEDWNNYEDDEE